MFVRKTFLLVIFGVSLVYIRGVYGATFNESTIAPVSDGVAIQQMPPYPGGDTFNPFFGQDHAYSVTFRGNGQAVVFLRVLFSNNGDTPLKELTLRFPKVEPEGILVYQVLRDKTCLRYDYNKSAVAPLYQYPCLEYGEPNYSDYYYGTNTYKKAKTALATDTLTVELPDSLASQKSGSVLLYFRAFGFAKKNAFGAYDYNFETLKVDDTIRNLRVGISPDSDLFIKGAQGNVDYFKESASVFESSKTMSVGASFRNTSVDTAMSNIGYGTVNKNASNLMPLDSYKVKGSYADSRFKLYAGTIIISVAVVATVLLALGFGIWRLFRTLNKKPAVSNSLNVNTSHTGINLTISALAGFVSASIITILIFLAYFFTRMVNSWAMDSWSSAGEVISVLPILATLLFVGLIGIFLIFPCIFVGIKRGIWWGLATFVFTLFWLFMAFVVLGLIFAAFRGPVPVNYLNKVM
ncbi:MAG: hypothetical protein WC988_01325 [Patescibacteria group bacterium]